MFSKVVGTVTLLILMLVVNACTSHQEPTWLVTDTSLSFERASVHGIQFAPSGEFLAIGTTEEIHLYRFPALTEVWFREEPSNTLAFSADGSLIASSPGDDTIIILNSNTGESVSISSSAYEDAYGTVDIAFSPDGNLLAATVNRSTTTDMVIVRNLPLLEEVLALQPEEPPDTLESVYGLSMRVVFSPDSSELASGWFGSRIILWDTESGTRTNDLQDLERAFGTVDGLDWHPDGALLASGHRGGTVAIWNSETGEILRSIVTGGNYAFRVRWSPSGDYLAVATYSGGVLLYDIEGNLLATLEIQDDIVNAIAWSPDEKYLAAGDVSGQVYIWENSEQ